MLSIVATGVTNVQPAKLNAVTALAAPVKKVQLEMILSSNSTEIKLHV